MWPPDIRNVPDSKTVNLGKEYDAQLREALRHTLLELGAIVTDKSWGVGGSQEVETLQVSLAGGTLSVDAETYVGLSITGAPDLVDRVAALVHERLR